MGGAGDTYDINYAGGETLCLPMNRGCSYHAVTAVYAFIDEGVNAMRMIWGGITAQHCTNVIIVEGNLTGVRYRDEMMEPVVVPFLHQHGPRLTFQQDNARPHTRRTLSCIFSKNFIWSMFKS